MLESRDRIGGRVHTDYSFGFPVDLGASWYVEPPPPKKNKKPKPVQEKKNCIFSSYLDLLDALDRYHLLFFSVKISFSYARLHGVCKENPLAPVIGRLGLPLYRTSGDNSVLYDHDLERFALLSFPFQFAYSVRIICCRITEILL